MKKIAKKAKTKILFMLSEILNMEDSKKSAQDGDTYSTYYLSQAEILTNKYSEFIDENEFSRGELITWKKGLKNKNGLQYGDLAIVIDLLKEPIYDTHKGSGSCYFREPLNLVIGFLNKNEELIILHVDSRRMQPARNKSQ